MAPEAFNLLYAALTQGLILGFATAAMIGPVNLMVVRKGILGGFQPAFLTGAGAALIDALCAYLVLTGILRVGFSGTWKILFWGLGAVMILYIGYSVLMEIRDDPALSQSAKVDRQTAFIEKPFVMGFLLVGSNPFALLYWVVMVATLHLSASVQIDPTGRGATSFFSSVLVGELAWYSLVAWGVHQSRNLFNPKWLTRISWVSGLGLLFYVLFMATKVVVHLIENGGMPFVLPQ